MQVTDRYTRMDFVSFLRWWTCVLCVILICKFQTVFSSLDFSSEGRRHDTGTQQYTREFLLGHQSTDFVPSFSLDIPLDILRSDWNGETKSSKKRKRGKRGGIMRRLRKNKTKPPLPSMILANIRSLNPDSDNKNYEELLANCRFQTEYRDSCLLCFSETWLRDDISDDKLTIDGFGAPFRSDRVEGVTTKQRGGGVCLYVNERWCNRESVTVKAQLCTPEVELLSVSLRPKYLPREFGRVFVTVVYAPVFDTSAAARAAATIGNAVRDLQQLSPNAPCFVVGDFNHCDLRKALPSFKQYVTIPTYKQKTIDMCYGNIPDAYKSHAFPPIGRSDHDTVYLVPAYRPKIQRERVEKKSVKMWSKESVEELQGCFECTDWDVFFNSCDDVNDATDVISSYVSFCRDMIIPSKTIKIFPNNKPWISKSLKSTLNEKKIAFQTGDRQNRKQIQAKLRKELKEAKRKYKEKVEEGFQKGNMAEAWKGLKTLSGQEQTKRKTSGASLKEQSDFSNKLNEFYCRFERHDLEEELKQAISLAEDNLSENEDFEIDSKQVQTLFRKLKTKKAVGPDNICGRLLKACASELCCVFSRLFTWSLQDYCVPNLWKNSTICPVPKKTKPACLNDYRPVALTSIVMKCFERVVLQRLLSSVKTKLDPNQFAYKTNRCTDDATLTLLHNTFTHLDKPNSFVRILFVDFSSAFNTIQPHLMAQKLFRLNVPFRLILWIIQFLCNRTQTVRYSNALSLPRSTSTGAPQGTVISPVLFTLYTNDCRGNNTTPLIKYSDDSALLDLSNSNDQYWEEVSRFCLWCQNNYLDLNVNKTKEMIIDFRSKPSPVTDLFIDGTKVERVTEYKYLGTVIDDKLTFKANTDAIHKKSQSRIHCLQQLRSLKVNSTILKMFYRSFVESVLVFSFLCWFGTLSVQSKNVLDRVVNVCSKVVGERQVSLNKKLG